MKNRILISMLLLLGNVGFSQIVDSVTVVEATPKVKKHGVGAAFGLVTGVGVSYRYRPSKFGTQLTYGNFEGINSRAQNVSLGFLYTLVQTEKTNLYVYQGSAMAFDKKEDGKGNVINDYRAYSGLGLGLEFTIAKRVALSFIYSYNYDYEYKSIDFNQNICAYYKF